MTDTQIEITKHPTRTGKFVKFGRGEVLAAHVILDRLAASMDWGSGFMTDEDVNAWNALAEAVGHRKIAVNEPVRGVGDEILIPLRYHYNLVETKTCDSYLDTSIDGADGAKEPVRFACSLRHKHRGDHLCYEAGDGSMPVFWHA